MTSAELAPPEPVDLLKSCRCRRAARCRQAGGRAAAWLAGRAPVSTARCKAVRREHRSPVPAEILLARAVRLEDQVLPSHSRCRAELSIVQRDTLLAQLR